MNIHDALQISAELTDHPAPEPLQLAYDRGYRDGYAAGLQAALRVVQRPRYTEPTCPDCGHPLTANGCEECSYG